MTTTVASTDPLGLVGKTLAGHFLVQSLVAEGRTSVVYRGEHVGPKRSVALKCLKISLSLDATRADTFLKRFREETRGYSQVIRDQPNFVRSIGTGMTPTGTGMHVPYSVLEWLDGYSLAQDIKMRVKVGEGGRPLPVVAEMLAPVARALASAHVQKHVHGDVASNNLFLAKVRGVSDVKILDFGVSHVVRDITVELSPSGSPAPLNDPFFSPSPGYGAPELLNPALGAPGAWSDVYSFAVVFMEALVGKLIRDASPLPSALGLALPESVEKVLVRALDPSPKERWPSLGEMWASLEDSLRVSAVAVPAKKNAAAPAMTARLGPAIPAQGGAPGKALGKETARLAGAPPVPGKILPAAGSKPNPQPAAKTTAMASPLVHAPDPVIIGMPVKMVHPIVSTAKPAPAIAKVESKKPESKKPDEKEADARKAIEAADEKPTDPRIPPSKVGVARLATKNLDAPPAPTRATFTEELKTEPQKSSPEMRKAAAQHRKTKPDFNVPSVTGKKARSSSSPSLPGEGQETPPLPPPTAAKNGAPPSSAPVSEPIESAPTSSGPSSVPPPPPAPGAVVLKAPGPMPAPPPPKPEVAESSKRAPSPSRSEQSKTVAATAPARRANVFIEDVPTVIVNDAPPPPKPSERSLRAADPIPSSGYGEPLSQLPQSAHLPQMQAHMQMPASSRGPNGHPMHVQSSPHAFVPLAGPPLHHLPPPPPPTARPGILVVAPNVPLPQQRMTYEERKKSARNKTTTVVVVSFLLAFLVGGVLLFAHVTRMNPAPVSASTPVSTMPAGAQAAPATSK
ncbi:MAG: protein kinase [Polyangiaceae bacterium]